MKGDKTMKLRCAIIGCGASTAGKGGAHSIAYAHAWAMRRVPETQLVAAASRTPKNIEDFVAEFPGTKGYRDYREMLQSEKPDLVSVCAFPPDREAMVGEAIRNGAKAVWIEKPFALGLGVAKRLMAAAAGTGCRLFVNHQRRYGLPFEWWREAVVEGKIGTLEGIDIAQPFDNFMNFGPHLVDAALFAMGPDRKATEVIAAVDTTSLGEFQGHRIEAQLVGSVHFSDGVRLSVEVGRKACQGLPVLRANGTHGFAEMRLDPLPGEGAVFRAQYAGHAGIASPATNEHFHHSEDGTLYVHRALVDIVQGLGTGSATRIEGGEAYRGLEIMMGLYESGRVGRMLSFPISQELFPLDIGI
jgi:predicted dehydrogenase